MGKDSDYDDGSGGKLLVLLSKTVATIQSVVLPKVIFCFIFSMLHLFVLTRKTMRTSASNILLIGLVVCNIFILANKYVKYTFSLSNVPCVTCGSEVSNLTIYTQKLGYTSQGFLYRMVFWISIMMAVSRLIARHILRAAVYVSSLYNELRPYVYSSSVFSSQNLGWMASLILLIINIIFGILSWIPFDIEELTVDIRPDECYKPFDTKYHNAYVSEKIIDNYAPLYYSLEVTTCVPTVLLYSSECTWQRRNLIPNHFLKLHVFIEEVLTDKIPKIILPILMVFLIRDLWKSKRSTNKCSISSTDKLEKEKQKTYFVIYILASYAVVEYSKVIFRWMAGILYPRNKIMMDIATAITFIFSELEFINIATQGLVCYAILKQYKYTLKAVLGKHLEPKILRSMSRDSSVSAISKNSKSFITTVT